MSFQKFGGQAAEPETEKLTISLTKGTERAEALRQEASLGRVVENRVLTKGNGPVKRHIGEPTTSKPFQLFMLTARDPTSQ